MNNKKQVSLDDQARIDCCEFQKKCVEAFAEIAFKYNSETQLKIFNVGICLIISNLMTSLDIKETDDSLDCLIDKVKRAHKKIQNNASYMEYANGKKVSEGNFN